MLLWFVGILLFYVFWLFSVIDSRNVSHCKCRCRCEVLTVVPWSTSLKREKESGLFFYSFHKFHENIVACFLKHSQLYVIARSYFLWAATDYYVIWEVLLKFFTHRFLWDYNQKGATLESVFSFMKCEYVLSYILWMNILRQKKDDWYKAKLSTKFKFLP